MRYVQIAQDKQNLISLEEAKNYLKIDSDVTEDDALIEMLILAAIRTASKVMNQDILKTTWKATAYEMRIPAEIELKRAAFLGVDKIEYKDKDGQLKEISDDKYCQHLGGYFGKVCINASASLSSCCDNFFVTFKTGMEFVPEDIKAAILQHLASLYENRGDCGGGCLPAISKMIYSNYMVEDIVTGM